MKRILKLKKSKRESSKTFEIWDHFIVDEGSDPNDLGLFATIVKRIMLIVPRHVGLVLCGCI